MVFEASKFPLARCEGLFALALASACALPPVEAGLAAPKASEAELVQAAMPVVSLCAQHVVRTWHYFDENGGEHALVGKAFGKCEVQVADDKQESYRFDSRYELQQGETTLRGEAQIVLAKDGRVLRLSTRADDFAWQAVNAGGALRVESESDDSRADGPGLELKSGDGFMGFMTPYFEELMLAAHELRTGDNGWRVISLGTTSAEPWRANVYRKGRSIALETSLGESILIEERKIQTIDVTQQGLRIVAVANEKWPTWTLRPPKRLRYEMPANARFSRVEVEVPKHNAGDPSLFGELLIGEGEGPRPGVLFLGSSAPADRYGFAGPPAVDLGYHHITDALASAGNVVMRFDARGRGRSDDGLVSWNGDKSDARRALATLLAASEVDPTRIVIVGHGEGGIRALHLANERPREVVGVALLSTPAQSQAAALAGTPDVLGAIRRGSDVPAGLLPHLRWLQEILDEDPLALLSTTTCRLLILHGVKDFELDAAQAHDALRRAGLQRPISNPHLKTNGELFDSLDHLLRFEPEASNQQSYMDRRPIDARVLDALVKFVATAR